MTESNIEQNIDDPTFVIQPWDNTPENVYFYDEILSTGQLKNFSLSAEYAYKRGWDIEHNYIAIDDTQVSDIDDNLYRKDVCPMKTEQDLLKDQYRLEIAQLKKQLSDTDYKAIKFAEGEINPEDYLPIKNQRAEWRVKINKLQEDFNI